MSLPAAPQLASYTEQFLQTINVYSPLGPSQTRFLTILPASSIDDSIRAKLVLVSLDDIVIASYEALSYTWDSEIFTCGISVDDSPLMVTANLFEAIRHLRDPERSRTIWIDAVCINQQDLAERSRQVLHMANIYKAVRHVVIWLGKEDYNGTPGLAMRPRDLKALNSLQLRAVNASILERNWWHRSWVVQEFLHAQTSIFLIGPLALALTDVALIMEVFQGPLYGSKYSHIYNFWRSKNSYKKDILQTFMIDFGHSQVTDPRDKVFAFLGVAQDGNEIIPDYTASVEQVYTDVVKMYVRKYENIDITCLHHRGWSTLNSPSWVPDWSVSRNTSQNWTVDYYDGSLYRAGFAPGVRNPQGHSKVPENCAITESLGVLTLRVYGVSIGFISDMAEPIDTALFETDGWIKALCSWKPLNNESGKYLTGESIHLAFHRTVVADRLGITRVFHMREDLSESLNLEGRFLELFSGRVNGLNDSIRLAVQTATCCSRFAKLSSGHMALVPVASQKGDEICVLRGGSTPMGLRREPPSRALISNPMSDADAIYRMIGSCYVHGVMDGEMYKELNSLFTIV